MQDLLAAIIEFQASADGRLSSISYTTTFVFTGAWLVLATVSVLLLRRAVFAARDYRQKNRVLALFFMSIAGAIFAIYGSLPSLDGLLVVPESGSEVAAIILSGSGS